MMKILLIFLSILISQAQGCGPGTGTLGTKATFQFDMIPATIYTWCEVCGDSLHEQISEDFARKEVTKDITNSINQVLQANSIPLNDVNPPAVTYTPPKITIAADGAKCEEATKDQGFVIGETIWKVCAKNNGTYSQVLYSVPLKVQVTAISAIYQSQWDTLASQVEDKMRALRGSDFNEATVVTVSN